MSQHAVTDGMRVDDTSFVSSGPPEHHGINLIIAKLVEFGKDTDENLRLLFGSEIIVLGAWMCIIDTMVLHADAPANTPFAVKRNSLFDAGKLRPLLTCAHCSISVDEANHQKCGACRREVFCSKDCAAAEWVVHRIDCFRAQGKPISAKHLATASAEKAKRQQTERAKSNRDTLAHMLALVQSVEFDLAQTSFATAPLGMDCDGVPRRLDLSYYYLETMQATIKRYNIGLSCENEIAIGIPPVGTDGDRWVLFRNTANGAFVLLTFTKLFEGHSDGPFRGIAIDDVFVVKTAVPVSIEHSEKLRKARKSCSGEVEWMSVPRPIGAHINSGCSLLASWLNEAQLRATVPTKDLFYHVGSTRSIKTGLGYLGP